MRRLLLILILTFSFQSWTKADDIRDFEIEGMGIGDSLLKYVSLEEIKNNMITDYPGSKKFSRFFKKFLQYEHVQFHFKTNDKKFIIFGIEGVNYFPNNLSQCQEERSYVIEDIKATLNTSNIQDMGYQKHLNNDGSVRSETYNTYIEFDNGFLDMTCTNWSKDTESKSTATDSLKISFIDKEFDIFLQNEAY